MIGPAEGELVPGALQSARMHGLRHALMSRADVARRFPDFIVGDGMEAVFEPEAGVLRPEQHRRLHAGGVEVLAQEPR